MLALDATSAHAAAVVRTDTYTNGASSNWNVGSNWATNDADWPGGTGAGAIFNGAVGANRTVSLVDAITVGSISFNNDTEFDSSLTNGGGSLTFDAAGSGPATLDIGGSGDARLTLSATTTLTDSLIATVNGNYAGTTGALNYTGGTSGPGSFTKNGDGLMTFGTNAKSHQGPTVLNGGRTRMSLIGTPNLTSSFTINSGAQLTPISNGSYAFGGGAVPLNLNGTGLGAGSFSGNFPGAIRQNTDIAITIVNPTVLQTNTLLHVQGSASGSLTFTNVISGPGHLTFTADNSDLNLGQLVLSGANTYAGGTTVSGGNLRVSGAAATLGTGDVTVRNSLNARMTIGDATTADAIADTATLSLGGGGAGGVADVGFLVLGAGIDEIVGSLILGGVTQTAIGSYGSSASSADFQFDEYFAGTGVVSLVPEPTSLALLGLAGTALFGRRRRT